MTDSRQARLEEIKAREYETEQVCSCGQDVPWLITELEAAWKREAKLVGALCEVESYLHWHTDDLVGDDCIGDKKKTMSFNRTVERIVNALSSHKAAK